MCKWGTTDVLTIGGKPVDVDHCIARLVQALNFGGVATRASCCGHGKAFGNIALADGRELLIIPDYDTARRIEKRLALAIPKPMEAKEAAWKPGWRAQVQEDSNG